MSHLFHVSRCWYRDLAYRRRCGVARTEVEESEEDDDIAQVAGCSGISSLSCRARRRTDGGGADRPRTAAFPVVLRLPTGAPAAHPEQNRGARRGHGDVQWQLLRPFELVVAELHSHGVVLGKFRANAKGVVTGRVTIPRRTKPEYHTFELEGRKTGLELTARIKVLRAKHRHSHHEHGHRGPSNPTGTTDRTDPIVSTGRVGPARTTPTDRGDPIIARPWLPPAASRPWQCAASRPGWLRRAGARC